MDGTDTSTNNSGILTVADRSGNNNKTKSASAAGSPKQIDGKIGQGLSFYAASDYLSAGYLSSINGATGLTVSIWMRTPTTTKMTTEWHIIDMSSCSGLGNDAFELYAGATPGKVHFTAAVGASGASVAAEDSTNRLDDGSWHHLLGRYNGSRVQLFVDGVSQGPGGAGSNPVSDPGDSLEIGGRCNGNVFYGWNGDVDDARIYTRALSDDEIKRLYKIGSTLKQGVTSNSNGINDGLIAYWTLDGNKTSINNSGIISAIDSTTNANSATYSDATAPVAVPGKFGQALSFDGVDDILNAGSRASIDNISTATWTFWAKRTGSALGTFMYKSDNNTSAGWWIETRTSTSIGFVEVEGGSDGRRAISGLPGVGEWFHVAVTWTGGSTFSTMHLYLNGVEGTDSSTSNGSGGHTTDAAETLYIGSSNGGGGPAGNFFPGVLDDIRIYNRILSPDEIKRLYTMGR